MLLDGCSVHLPGPGFLGAVSEVPSVKPLSQPVAGEHVADLVTFDVVDFVSYLQFDAGLKVGRFGSDTMH